jgi:ATP-dependent DNA helicase RecG
MGTRQSGLPGFKMANLVRDVKILMLAREAAFELAQQDPQLKNLPGLRARLDSLLKTWVG